MTRKKQLMISIGLVVAVAAIFPVTAYAKPVSLSPDDRPYSRISPVTQSPDDRAFSRISEQPTVQVPYLSQGQGVISAELGFPASKSPDDRAFARGKEQQLAPVVRSDSGIEVDTAAISGFGLAALLVAGGMTLAIRSRRRTRLSPA